MDVDLQRSAGLKKVSAFSLVFVKILTILMCNWFSDVFFHIEGFGRLWAVRDPRRSDEERNTGPN